MHIEAAINGELTRRLETPVRQTLAAVLAGVRDHAPGERIADLFHHAFDAAVPLAKLGALDLTREGQLEVDRLVMRQLDASRRMI